MKVYLFYAGWNLFGISVILSRVIRGEHAGDIAVFATVLLAATGLGFLVLYFVRRNAPVWREPGVSAMSDSEIRAEADRRLTERIAEVLRTRDDYDEAVFRSRVAGGIHGLCARDLINVLEARWMLNQIFPINDEPGTSAAEA